MSLPKGYLSYNQIKLYQTCPQKYYYSYIEERKAPINDKIFLGMVFHATVEKYLEKKIEGTEISLHESQDIFKELFTSMKEGIDISWDCPIEKVEKRGLSFIAHFTGKIAYYIDPMMVEKELEVDIPGMDIKLRGIIDLVEKDFTITDFKTTTQKWSKERIKSSYLQMVIYKYLFEKSFDSIIKDLKIRILYAKNDSPIKNQLVVRNANDFDYQKMFDIIRFVAENIEKGAFYKNEGYMCNFCEHAGICRKKI